MTSIWYALLYMLYGGDLSCYSKAGIYANLRAHKFTRNLTLERKKYVHN